ncbi:hypothetical protein STEG23_021703, partial [Scotinomys teguina]
MLRGLPGNPTSSLHGGLDVFSSCCLALDSSSSFPCPAFRAIAKSGTKPPLSLLDELLLTTNSFSGEKSK